MMPTAPSVRAVRLPAAVVIGLLFVLLTTSHSAPVTARSAAAATSPANGAIMTLSAARAAADDTTVTVSGSVGAVPGAFDAQSKRFYVQDDHAGLAIYFNAGNLPTLAEGDQVTVTGTMTTYKTERELQPASINAITKNGHSDPPVPLPIKTGQIGNAPQGRLVSFSGKVTTAKNGFMVDDGSGAAHVFIYKTTGISQTPADGQTAAVIGIAAIFNGAAEVLPRHAGDLLLSGNAAATSVPTATLSSAQRERGSQPTPAALDSDPRDAAIEIAAVYASTDEQTVNEQAEAVQLFNSSDQPLPLKGWALSDNTHRVALDGLTLAPQQVVWLARNAARFQAEFDQKPAAEYGAPCSEIVPCLSGSALTLDNQGGDVSLNSPAGVVDTLAYGDGYTDVPGWKGPAVQLYRFADYVPTAGQIFYRKLDLAHCLPVAPNQHQASDWAQDPTDPNAGRRLRFPGWSTQFCDTAKGTDNATTTFLVAPDNSLAGLLTALDHATREIDLELYFLTSPAIVDHLTAALGRGVKVRALFDGDLKPGDQAVPLAGGAADAYLQTYWAAQEISAHGGTVDFWVANTAQQPPIPHRYNDDHQKFVIIDSTTSVISSENFAQTAFPLVTGDHTDGNRGAVIITDAPTVTQRLSAIFSNDDDPTRADVQRWKKISTTFARPTDSPVSGTYALIQPQPLTIHGPTAFELLNAPDNTLNTGDALIGMVTHAGKGDRVLVEQQYEYLNWGSPTAYMNPRLSAYIDAARRGANVQILLDGVNSFSANQPTLLALNKLASTERLQLAVKITGKTGVSGNSFHIKMVLVSSGADGFVHVGSLNGSENSARYNREVALQVQSRAAFDYYAAVFDHDWQATP